MLDPRSLPAPGCCAAALPGARSETEEIDMSAQLLREADATKCFARTWLKPSNAV